MKTFERVKQAWEQIAAEQMNAPVIQRILAGKLEKREYAAILREIYFNTRENPQLQALAAVRLRGYQREMVKPFLKHAISEVGHDQLALNDMQNVGVDTAHIKQERALPFTQALTAYGFWQIEHRDPVGYLGYLFHLEFLPTRLGADLAVGLFKSGIPETAMSFLKDHSVIDIGHNKLMIGYVESLVQSEKDFDHVVNAMRVTAKIYSQMLEDACEQARRSDRLTDSTVDTCEPWLEMVTPVVESQLSH